MKYLQLIAVLVFICSTFYYKVKRKLFKKNTIFYNHSSTIIFISIIFFLWRVKQQERAAFEDVMDSIFICNAHIFSLSRYRSKPTIEFNLLEHDKSHVSIKNNFFSVLDTFFLFLSNYYECLLRYAFALIHFVRTYRKFTIRHQYSV